MLNILKMDFYRFRHNKIMYLLLLVFCAFQIFGIFMTKQYAQEMEKGGVSVSSLNESDFIQYTISQPPSWMLIYIAVFTIFFYTSEFSSGFHKNYIPMQRARIHSVCSKILVLAAFVCLLFVTMLLADWIGRSLFFDNTSMGDPMYLIRLLISQFMLHWAFSILILYIVMVVKNVLVSLTAGFVLALNVAGIALSALESLVNGPHLSQYLLINTIVRVKDFNNINDVIHTAAVAVIVILVFGFLAVRYKLREDLS